jgi:Flp pilus assembly protein TadG
MILLHKTQPQREKRFIARDRVEIRCDSGQAIVEFALIAPLLLGLLGGILEFSGILFAQTLLEGGAREASRYGITGSTADGVGRDEAILQIIDDNTFGIINTDELRVEMRIYESFADVGQPEPFTDENGNGSFDPGEVFDDINGNGAWDEDMGVAGLGGPGDVVVYRLNYDWAIMIPLFRPFFGDTVTLDASIAVRNEPFGS